MRRLRILGLAGTLLLSLAAACASREAPGVAPTGDGPAATAPTASAESIPGELLRPEDLTYLGAFRLPDGPAEIGWEYSGAALAYYPEGDPGGADGFPGSLFGTGHNWNQWVSEISIPVPVNSPSKNLEVLNVATTLQEFHDIRGDLFGPFEIPRVGLAILTPQGEQASAKLYFSWAQHMGEGDTSPSTSISLLPTLLFVVDRRYSTSHIPQ